ncbi:MAG: hypothetical protein LBT40_15570 [Deltaproteobacteria bacterium]|jgi:hypothetical protein|nr:hypothetical protein [Deltaproteobacteria bacterium]
MKKPKALSKSGLLAMVSLRVPDIPPQVTRMAVELVLKSVPEALAEGRPVSLRGFGRLIPRRYRGSSTKQLGLLFHPSPRLARLVASGPDAETDWKAGKASGPEKADTGTGAGPDGAGGRIGTVEASPDEAEALIGPAGRGESSDSVPDAVPPASETSAAGPGDPAAAADPDPMSVRSFVDGSDPAPGRPPRPPRTRGGS